MKRDMDFCRELLLQIEEGQHTFNMLTEDTANIFEIYGRETVSKEYSIKAYEHLRLLIQAKLVSSSLRESEHEFCVGSITWLGHDFLAIYRDDARWNAAKDAVRNVGDIDFGSLMKIGKAMMKARLQRSGIAIS